MAKINNEETEVKTTEEVKSVSNETEITTAEKMADEEGEPYTAHTTKPVPVVITNKNIKIRDGILSDLAPTLLELLGIEIPADMTSKSLIVSK